MKKQEISQKEKPRPAFSVVVPVYNSGASVEKLAEQVKNAFENIIDDSFEVIFVDDGSTHSETWLLLDQLATKYPFVTSVKLRRNFGRAGAVLCGMSLARGDWIITMDDDLQQLPEDIPILLQYKDHDVVVGTFRKKQHTRFQILSSWVKGFFDRIILQVPCRMSPFNLIKAEVARDMLQISTASPFIPALISHITDDIVGVDVQHHVSANERSRYNLVRKVTQFSHLMIGNSSLLLRIVGFLGIIVFITGLVIAFYMLYLKLAAGRPFSVGTVLIPINLVLGGLTMTALGIIGEYLMRILNESYGKRPFIMKEVKKQHIRGGEPNRP